MKKIRSLMVGVVLVVLLLTFFMIRLSKANNASSNVLNIYNWGDYVDPELLKTFEKEYGYKVNYETFDSNEAMEAKIKQGGTSYDITIPSEYMVQKMKKEHLLLPLDHRKIKGLSNIDARFLNMSFDQGNTYSVPYFWGTLGIVYNDQMMDGEKIKHWSDLWRPELKNNILLIDGAREIMGLSLTTLGKSINSTDLPDLHQAVERLDQLAPNVKALVADEIKMYMANNESAVAVTFSGEAVAMLEANKHLHYVVPPEGSNLWFDNIVIPKTSKNQKGAYDFINFMLKPENAAKNAEYIGYSTPNKQALKLLPKETTQDPQFYPNDQTMRHLEVYKDLGAKSLEIYNDLYLEFKMYRK